MTWKKDTRSDTVVKRECGKKYAQWLDKESVGKGAKESEGIESRKKKHWQEEKSTTGEK